MQKLRRYSRYENRSFGGADAATMAGIFVLISHPRLIFEQRHVGFERGHSLVQIPHIGMH